MKSINTALTRQVHNVLIDALYQVYQYDEKLNSDLYSWDKGDCSEIGLALVYIKFILSHQTNDYYGEYDDSVTRLKALVEELPNEN